MTEVLSQQDVLPPVVDNDDGNVCQDVASLSAESASSPEAPAESSPSRDEVRPDKIVDQDDKTGPAPTHDDSVLTTPTEKQTADTAEDTSAQPIEPTTTTAEKRNKPEDDSTQPVDKSEAEFLTPPPQIVLPPETPCAKRVRSEDE
eukprot:c16126_g1_i1.p1 GENE.c16126_g1_i1~~c16126_g1_i1.p1  ORF type:complete len:165 (+),score=41.37 c16126_g1_i1:59-496(+)